jgi:hypothetical protein
MTLEQVLKQVEADVIEATHDQQVGPDQKLWFKNDSDLDRIRNHPRYHKLLELAG